MCSSDLGKLIRTVTKKIQLGKQTISTLNFNLGNKKSFGAAEASCFDPHLGFVYYYKDSIIAYLTICMDCNRLYPSIELPTQKQGKVGKGKEAYYTGQGMSMSFRHFLNTLLKKYKFSHSSELDKPFAN